MTARYSTILMGSVLFLFVFFHIVSLAFILRTRSLFITEHWHFAGLARVIFFYGMSMVMIQSLNGAGDTRTPTLINFFCFWLFQIPLAYLLAYGFHLKATGAFIAVPVAETAIALAAWYFFRKGKWKTVKV